MEKLNTCGGAIALGHPLAASGARYLGLNSYSKIKIKYGMGYFVDQIILGQHSAERKFSAADHFVKIEVFLHLKYE